MVIRVKTRDEAWAEANKIFPTDYEKDEESSKRAGYPIYRSAAADHYHYWISDLNNQLEVNMPDQTVNIVIQQEAEKKERPRYKLIHYGEKAGNSQHELQLLAADIIQYGETLNECHHVTQEFNPDGTERTIDTGSYCVNVRNNATGIMYWVHFSGCRVTEIIECR